MTMAKLGHRHLGGADEWNGGLLWTSVHWTVRQLAAKSREISIP